MHAVRSGAAAFLGAQTFFYHSGGRDWPGLCATGKEQSPIDIVEGKTTPLMPRHRAERSKWRVGLDQGYTDHWSANTVRAVGSHALPLH